MDKNDWRRIAFLGLADRLIERDENSFRLGTSDLKSVSLIKYYALYP